jgi:membrane protease YdiL (CAAX protease family)
MVRTLLSKIFRKEQHPMYAMEREKLLENRLSMTVFFIFAFTGSSTVDLFLFYLYLKNSLTMDQYQMITVIFFAVLLCIGYWIIPYHPRHFGLRISGWQKSVSDGLLFGGIGFGIALTATMYLISTGLYSLSFNFEVKNLFYPISALVQEAAIKGLFQSYLMAILDGHQGRKWVAIGIPALIFAQFHLVMGIPMFFLSYIFCFITGWIYERNRSIISVWIIHLLTGLGGLIWLHW